MTSIRLKRVEELEGNQGTWCLPLNIFLTESGVKPRTQKQRYIKKEKEGRKEGRREGRKEGKKEGRKEGRKKKLLKGRKYIKSMEKIDKSIKYNTIVSWHTCAAQLTRFSPNVSCRIHFFI